MEDNSWKNSLTNSLRQAWDDQLYTDLTIVTADETITAHKLILAVASPYFRALLNVNLNESSTSCLTLENISGETLRVILKYIYSGKTDLTEENSTEILTLADYFQIQDLKRFCCIYIRNTLTPKTCLQVYELALLHRCQELADYAFEMAVKNCFTVIWLPSFMEVQPSTLEAMFKQPILDVSSEDELFKALMMWVNYKGKERRCHCSRLLSLIRESQMNPMSRTIYFDKVADEEIERIGETSTSTPDCIIARHKKEEELIIVFGGESNGRIMGSAECIALGWTSWCCSIPNYTDEMEGIHHNEGQQVIPPMNIPRTYPAIAVKGNIVYLIGGQSSNHVISSCETYHVLTNEWHPFPDLPVSLHGEEAIFLQNNLWVIGSRRSGKNEVEKALLMFDPYRDKWITKNVSFTGRVHFGIAGIHESLFIVGGMGLEGKGKQRALSSCQKYDAETDFWIDIAPMNQRRAYHKVAMVDDFIYAIGGYDGCKWLSSVERYDPLQDRWTYVSPMISTRSSFGVTVSHGRIYCIGGFSGESILNTVEKYNPRTDMWHCVQSMRLRRYGVVAATLKLPSEKLVSSQFISNRE